LKRMLWLGGVPSFFLFLSIILIKYFIFWTLFNCMTLYFGIAAILYSLISNLNHIKKNKDLVRIAGVLAGFVITLIILNQAVSSLRDIGSYLSKDYSVIKGTPDHISSMGSKVRTQTIEIENMKLTNAQRISRSDYHSEMEIYYLPRSKYVIKINVLE